MAVDVDLAVARLAFRRHRRTEDRAVDFRGRHRLAARQARHRAQLQLLAGSQRLQGGARLQLGQHGVSGLVAGLALAVGADRGDHLLAGLVQRHRLLRGMRGNADDHAVVGGTAQGDRIAGGTVLHQHFGEGGAQHGRISGDATGGRAGDRAQGLQRQVHFLGGSGQVARALVDGIDQAAGQLVEAALAIGLQLLGGQRVTHFLERLALATTHRGDLDDVVAEVGLHRADHVTRLGGEQGVFERLDHRATLDPAQITALVLRTRVFRVGLGQRREVGTRRLGFGSELVRLGFGTVTGDQDVRSLALFRRGELRLLVFIALAQGRFVSRGRCRQVGAIDLDVFQRHAFGLAEILAVAVVPLLDLLIGDRRGIGRNLRQRGQFDVAGLTQQLQQALGLGLGDEARILQARRDHRLLQALAHQLLELRGGTRRIATGQSQAVVVLVELAVRIEEGRDGGDVLAHRAIADHNTGLLAHQAHDLLVDQLIEHGHLVFSAFERARVEVLALLLALTHALLLEAGAEILRADLVVLPQHAHRPPRRCRTPPGRRRGNLGHVLCANATQVAVVDHEQERNHQQPQDHGDDPA
ncbi:hypothetical protein PGKDCPLP_02877 [Stenotrophomonas maltophilia]|nr:hypothetical protein PGKDCPLP_02877 [Stenotrophomonas maltophilia]